ncbi:MAG: hypothetical protein Q7T20_18180 [Saprospiraceae bacterium]|nr:hypothetical protein [Saprospiraceae bacterium]
MRRFIQIVLLLALSATAFGQKTYPLKVADDSIVFHLAVQNGRLALVAPADEEFFKSKNDFPTLLALRLEASDLVLEYQPRKSTDMASNLTLRLQLPDGQQLSPLPYEFSDVETSPGMRRLVWLDAAERLPDFSATYVLHVRRALMGAVNCEGPRPAFTLKKQLPHYAVGGVGLVLVGLGQVYRNQRDDRYADYQQRWQDGFPAPDESNSPLNAAKEKDRNARICTWTGLAVLGIDALLFARRSLNFKKKQRVYDKFCGTTTSLNLRPVIILGSGLGMAISCHW